jgi:hypothetical protein
MMPPTSFTITLDWRDYCTAGVSVLLVLSFQLAFRSREVAAGNNRRSMILFLWSGVLLFVGHGVLFVVAAFVSLEGLWIVNVTFMYQGIRATVRLALGLRRLRRAAVATPVSEDAEPTDNGQPATAPEPLPAVHATNGHQLPAQRPTPTGSGPWPHRGAHTTAAGERHPMTSTTGRGRVAALLAAAGLLAAVVGQYGHTLHAARIAGHPTAELPVHEPSPLGVPWITGW